MSTKEEIALKAKDILASFQDGLRRRDLRHRLMEFFPDVPEKTIDGSTWNLDSQFPAEICKPAWGTFCLTKFRKSESSSVSDNVEEKDGTAATEKKKGTF